MNWKSLLQVTLVVFCSALIHSKTVARDPGTLRSIIIADTQDIEIGYSCASDAYRLEKSLQAVGSQLRLGTDITVLDKRKCHRTDVEKWIHSLTPGGNDVVMVFYAGHGHEDQSGSHLPVLILRDGEVRGAALQEEIDRLPCKLSVVVFDCCNLLPEGFYPKKRHLYPVIHKNRRLARLKPLFFQCNASITMCAARTGELAWGGQNGGFLTTGFLRAMKDPSQTGVISWRRILTRAKTYSIKRSRNKQHPFFTIRSRAFGKIE